MRTVYGILAVAFVVAALAVRDRVARAAESLPEMLMTLALLLLIGLAAVLVVYLAFRVGARAGRSDRPYTGTYGMKRIKLGKGRHAWIVPEHIFGPGVIVDQRAGTVEEIPVRVPTEHYAPVRMAVQATRTMQAAMPPDDAYRHMPMVRNVGPTAAAMRAAMKEPRPLRPAPYMPALPEPEVVEGQVVDAPTVRNVIEASSSVGDTEVVLGVRGPELAVLDLYREPHLAVWGRSKTGKTRNIGLNIAAQQVARGMRVIVLDPEGGKDWAVLRPHVQVVAMDDDQHMPSFIRVWMMALAKQMAERGARLASAGVGSAYHLKSGEPMRPVCIHLEEYGALRQKLGIIDGQTLEMFDAQISEVAMKGASRALHLVTYAHVPEDVPKLVTANCAALTLKQGVNQGNSVGYWAAHQLGDGEFAFNGERYRALQFSEPDAKRLMSTVPALSPLSVGSKIGKVNGAAPEPATWSPVEAEGNRTWEDEDDFEGGVAEKRRLIEEWRRENPGGTQAELRRALEAQGVHIAKSWISQVWNEMTPQSGGAARRWPASPE